jgi:SAM-dependent methyltransferase
MKECSKSITRRLSDPNFTNRYFVGRGLDIGGKPDPLALYKELFCRMKAVRTWDWEDGDAQFLAGVSDGEYDFVHSSHCLEHLVDPVDGLHNWFRVVREGGYLVVTVPDEDLYEQGQFPSTFNRDHKWTFTIFKSKSWSDKSINLLDMVRQMDPAAEMLKLEQLSASYRFGLPRFDQTLTPIAECGIELVVRKRPIAELRAGGRWLRTAQQPEREVRLHLNQYKDDIEMMKQSNQEHQPFGNDSPL